MTNLVLGRVRTDPPQTAPAGSRRWNDPRVLLALAAILIGSLLTFSELRPEPPVEGSADVGFARDMSDHHAQAVAMAEIIRTKTTDPDIRILATDIALTQQAQIGQMRGWLDAWGLPVAGRGDPMAWMGHAGPMPGMASADEMRELESASGEEADELFLRLMIRHHRGGLLMASAALDQADTDETQILARAIRDGQASEIQAMEQMLSGMGAATETTAATMPRSSDTSGERLRDRLVVALGIALVAGGVGWLLVDDRARRAPKPLSP